MQLTVQLNDTWCLESPIYRTEGITETFSVKVIGGGAFSSPFAVAYKKKTAVTSTIFPSGSITAASNIITLKPATGFVGNSAYIIAITATENSNIRVYKFEVIIGKDEGEQ